MKKKAQVKLMETVGVLMVFFILLALGFMFYGNFQKTSIFREQKAFAQKKVQDKTITIMFMPEFKCSGKKEGCVDLEKIETLREILEDNSDYYFNVLGFARITLDQVYPENKSWVVYDNPKEDSSKLQTQVPVSIEDAINNRYYFGVLKVDIYP